MGKNDKEMVFRLFIKTIFHLSVNSIQEEINSALRVFRIILIFPNYRKGEDKFERKNSSHE